MKKITLLYLYLSVLLCGCSHYYYVASTHNVPLFRGKNELRLSGSRAAGEESLCSEVQAAWSVSDHIGIMANYLSAKGGEISNNTNWAKGDYFDGAIGYFKPINKNGVFELYGGIGRGNQHHHYMNPFYTSATLYKSDGGISQLSFTKVFIQPSFGLTFKGFDLAASSRICLLSFNNVNNEITGNDYESGRLNNISNNIHLFLNPRSQFGEDGNM